MRHWMQFLDRAGHVLNEMQVDATSDMDAFRMATDVWPTGANRVRMFSMPGFDGRPTRRPPRSKSEGETLGV